MRFPTRQAATVSKTEAQRAAGGGHFEGHRGCKPTVLNRHMPLPTGAALTTRKGGWRERAVGTARRTSSRRTFDAYGYGCGGGEGGGPRDKCALLCTWVERAELATQLGTQGASPPVPVWTQLDYYYCCLILTNKQKTGRRKSPIIFSYQVVCNWYNKSSGEGATLVLSLALRVQRCE